MAGRPPFKPTAAQRRRVAVAAGAGMAQESIALALNIAPHTLVKYFAHELSIGAQQKRVEVLEAMHKAAKKGNVAAQKAYTAMRQPQVAAPPLRPDEGEPAPDGKKAQAKADAVTAQTGTEWENLLPPAASVQ